MRFLLVDEIQRLPSLLNEVHRCMEERRVRFALRLQCENCMRLEQVREPGTEWDAFVVAAPDTHMATDLYEKLINLQLADTLLQSWRTKAT